MCFLNFYAKSYTPYIKERREYYYLLKIKKILFLKRNRSPVVTSGIFDKNDHPAQFLDKKDHP
jgi:hypothetical protein